MKKQQVSFENAICGREGKGERLLVASPPPACLSPAEPHHPHTGRGGHILVRVLAEDVLDDHNGFLDHVVDLGLDEVEQRAHTALCRLLWEEECGQSPCTHFQQNL